MKEVRTTCPYCGVGCGVRARRLDDGTVITRGDEAHPSNYGRLCSKGSALGETVGLEGRLLEPRIEGRPASWDEALNRVAEGFSRVIASEGRDAVAFYVSGQMLTEDYYVANKLLKGFVGTANIDTNSRLCMASSVVGHKRAFGSDTVPVAYEDIERAELFVLVGSNAAYCHPILFQRMQKAREDDPGKKLVVVDPRRTATCEGADLHLPIAPGTDAILWNGLLAYLSAYGVVDYEFLEAHTEGFGAALRVAKEVGGPHAVASACGISEEDLLTFYRLFARTERVLSFYSQGIHQSSSGSDKVNAIINCHLLTGRIGKPGAGPFSLTGQPNAMGGREVGGLANGLAAHMDFTPEDVDRVKRFWNAPHVANKPGLKAVELFDAIEAGRVRAVWIMCTNPVVSLPDADRVRAALARCELVVVSECMAETDTTRLAHVLLPALTWGEKDGTVTNSERRISRQRPFLPAPGLARADWAIMADVGRRMGFVDAFTFASAADVFDEYARLTAFENDGARDLDLGGLAGLTQAEYDALDPVQWPVRTRGAPGAIRMFTDGRFFTPSRRARFLPIVPRSPENLPDADYPLVLNTGRVRDQWHTMTRTGASPRLAAHKAEPFVEISEVDATRFGVAHGELARISSRLGAIVARVEVSPGQRVGSIFVPIHFHDRVANAARVGTLIPSVTDPYSGQPEAKHAPARIDAFRPALHGFVITRRAMITDGLAYWAKAKVDGGFRYEIAEDAWPDDLGASVRARLGIEAGEWIEMQDGGTKRHRAACLVDGRLEACFFAGPDLELPPRDWLAKLLGRAQLDEHERMGLLLGRPIGGVAEQGPIVCSCFQVGENAIVRAIREEGLSTAEEIGARLRAGTNCGSCIPELRALCARNLPQAAE